MPHIELAPEVGDDLGRILKHLQGCDAPTAGSRIEGLIRAIDVLESSPLIGRPAKHDMRELVIGRQSQGYIALYRYIQVLDTVFILAIRNQREAGYKQV